jgi:hypothetical protein
MVTHEKVGHTNQGLWHHKGMQLPAYIQHIANDLIKERGMTESRAIATAISRCKVWCAGGGNVNPDTKAKACAAVAEWERLKAQSKVTGAAEAPDLVTIPGVDILAAGTWKLSSGEQTFTKQDLADGVEAAKCPAVGEPLIKIGHTDTRFIPGDGEPAIGKVANLRLAAEGTKVKGDLAGMPGWLGSIAASAFPRRSVEGKYNFACQVGHKHPFVITALALLGVTQPGVGVLSGLNDIAALYGVQAAAEQTDWRTEPQDESEGQVMPAITAEDVRRAYYEAAGTPKTYWIAELQMAPAQLIVADAATDKVYRIPYRIAGEAVEFEDAEELVSYGEVAAARGTGQVVVYASAEESRPGIELDDDLDESWDTDLGDLPDLTGIGVEELSAAAGEPLAAAPKLGTGTRFKKLESSLKKKGAKNPGALAAWIGRKKFGKKKFAQLAKKAHASAEVQAADHGDYSGTHTHAHRTYGEQGGDVTHEHEHSHDGDGNHEHAHASAGQEGVAAMPFNEEQQATIRAKLGLPDDEELTEEVLFEAIRKLAEPGKRIAASRMPDGVVAIDSDKFEELQRAAKKGEEALERMRRNERDTILASAMQDGKFSPARREHWAKMWDADPESTRAVIASLKKNQVPLEDLGVPGSEDDILEDEYRSLFPPARA